MKKNIIAISTILSLLFVNAAVAQTDVFEKGVTLKFGLNLPSSNNGDLSEFNTDWGTSNPGSLRPISTGSNLGFGFQFGTMYFIDAIDLGTDMKIGIDVSYIDLNYTSVNYDFKTITGKTVGTDKLHFLQMGFMVGPSFSYSLVDDMSLDLALKFNPSWSYFNGNIGVTDEATGTNYNDRYSGISYFQLGFVPAFYFRYNVLLIGFEYNIITANHQISEPISTNNLTNKTNLSRMKFVVGFKF